MSHSSSGRHKSTGLDKQPRSTRASSSSSLEDIIQIILPSAKTKVAEHPSSRSSGVKTSSTKDTVSSTSRRESRNISLNTPSNNSVQPRMQNGRFTARRSSGSTQDRNGDVLKIKNDASQNKATPASREYTPTGSKLGPPKSLVGPLPKKRPHAASPPASKSTNAEDYNTGRLSPCKKLRKVDHVAAPRSPSPTSKQLLYMMAPLPTASQSLRPSIETSESKKPQRRITISSKNSFDLDNSSLQKEPVKKAMIGLPPSTRKNQIRETSFNPLSSPLPGATTSVPRGLVQKRNGDQNALRLQNEKPRAISISSRDSEPADPVTQEQYRSQEDILDLQREIKILRMTAAANENRFQDIQQELTNFRGEHNAEREKMTRELQNAREEVDHLKKVNGIMQEKHEQVFRSYNALKEQIVNHDDKFDAALRTVQTWQNKFEEEKKKTQAFVKQLSSLEETVEIHENFLEDARRRRREVAQTLKLSLNPVRGGQHSQKSGLS